MSNDFSHVAREGMRKGTKSDEVNFMNAVLSRKVECRTLPFAAPTPPIITINPNHMAYHGSVLSRWFLSASVTLTTHLIGIDRLSCKWIDVRLCVTRARSSVEAGERSLELCVRAIPTPSVAIRRLKAILLAPISRLADIVIAI